MRRRVFMAGVAGSALLAAGTSIARAQAAAWDDIAGSDGVSRLQMPNGYRYAAIPGSDGGTVRTCRLLSLGSQRRSGTISMRWLPPVSA